MPQPARQLILGAIVFLVQWLVLGRLQIFGAYPDIVLLFVAWLGIRNGRLSGSAGGFVLGFLLDAVYQTWGIHMFVKTLVGFLVGLFPANELETLLIQPRLAFLGDLVIAFVPIGLMVMLMALGTGAWYSLLVEEL